jgi:hypothetical protein
MIKREIKNRSNPWKTVLFITFLLILSSSFIVEGNTDDTEIVQVTYNFDNPKISTVEIYGDFYDRITIQDCYTASNSGEPNIPSKGANILLPPSSKVANIEVIGNKMIKLGETFDIEPTPKAIPISNLKISEKIVKNKEIYENDELFPGRLFTKVAVQSFRGYDILVLLLHPVQYNPVSGELFYYQDISVIVHTTLDTPNSLFRGLNEDKLEVMKKVDNPQTAELYFSSTHHEPNFFDSYNLMILTTDSLKTSFEPLKDAHEAKGQSTVIKTLTDVGSSNTEDIRDYIKDAYLNWGVNYVLLGGDADVVTARILWVEGMDENTTHYETYMPSDLYYSCLDGPYNYDGDNKWGEPEDGEGGGEVDLYADVHVGRACVDDASDVNNFVTKTVAYINKDPEDEYLQRICLAGEYMGDYGIATWGGNYLDQFKDTCTDDGYTTIGIPTNEYDIIELYDRDWDYNDWPKQEIMDVIDNGVHMIHHLGHSSYEYAMKMYYEDCYGLSNTDFCFIYSQGCMAGGFDYNYADCIAEHSTVKTDTGAFAVIMNARYGWFWSYSTDGDSQRFHREYLDAVYGEGIPEIGRANSDSKEDNLPIIGRSCIRWVYYEANLFGDPSLRFYEYENNPPNTPNIEGPPNGKVGIEYEYCLETVVEPDGDSVYVYWEWGDGEYNDWDGPYDQGEEICASHTWDEEGTYVIKAKLKDEFGAESDWGELQVTIPRNKNLYKSYLNFFQFYPNLLQIFKLIMQS